MHFTLPDLVRTRLAPQLPDLHELLLRGLPSSVRSLSRLSPRVLSLPVSSYLSDDIEAVGDVLPEFAVLVRRHRSPRRWLVAHSSHSNRAVASVRRPTSCEYTSISLVAALSADALVLSRCNECVELFQTEPELRKRFEEEQAETAAKLKEMGIEL